MKTNKQYKHINKIISVFSTAMILLSTPVNVSAEYVSSPVNFTSPVLEKYETNISSDYYDFSGDHLNDILITSYSEKGNSYAVQKLDDLEEITDTTKDKLNDRIGDSLVDAKYDLDETSNHNYENLWDNLKDISASEKKTDKENFLKVLETYNDKEDTTKYKQNNLVIADLFDITLYCSNKKYEKNFEYYLSDDSDDYLTVTLSYNKGIKPIVLHKYFDDGFEEEYTKKSKGEWLVVPYGAVSSKDNYTKTITIKFDCLCAIAFLIPQTSSSSGSGSSGAVTVTSKATGSGVSSTIKSSSTSKKSSSSKKSSTKNGSGTSSTTDTTEDTENNETSVSTDTTDKNTTTDQESSKEDNTKECCNDWICKNLFGYRCCHWLCMNDKCWCWVLVVIIIIFLLIIAYLIYKQIHDRRKQKELEEELQEDELL